MSSAKITTVLDSAIFPTVSMPVTVLLIAMLVSVIVAGFFAIFFWNRLMNMLFSSWIVQRTTSGDFLDALTPSEKTGLDPFIIKSFPVFHYSSTTIKNHETECSICLSEFSDRDTIRQVTICHHIFHVNCIDIWFESHKTCPVCRCELDPNPIGSGSHESLQNTVTIAIQDPNQDEEHRRTTSPSKRLMEPSAWRFWRSHSTGHVMVKTPDCNMKNKRKNYQTGNYIDETLPTSSSSKMVMEPSDWRFSSSHSTGHFKAKTVDINPKFDGRHYLTGTNAAFEETPPTTSSIKRVMEDSDWRFSRSHSTGHCVVKTTDVIKLKLERKHYLTGSCVNFNELFWFGELVEYNIA